MRKSPSRNFLSARRAELRRLVEAKQREYNLGTVEIYPAQSEAIVAVSDNSKNVVDLKPDDQSWRGRCAASA